MSESSRAVEMAARRLAARQEPSLLIQRTRREVDGIARPYRLQDAETGCWQGPAFATHDDIVEYLTDPPKRGRR